jgi:hypothetical protein
MQHLAEAQFAEESSEFPAFGPGQVQRPSGRLAHQRLQTIATLYGQSPPPPACRPYCSTDRRG